MEAKFEISNQDQKESAMCATAYWYGGPITDDDEDDDEQGATINLSDAQLKV